MFPRHSEGFSLWLDDRQINTAISQRASVLKHCFLSYAKRAFQKQHLVRSAHLLQSNTILRDRDLLFIGRKAGAEFWKDSVENRDL